MVVLLKFWIFVNGNYGEVLRKRVSNVMDLIMLQLMLHVLQQTIKNKLGLLSSPKLWILFLFLYELRFWCIIHVFVIEFCIMLSLDFCYLRLYICFVSFSCYGSLWSCYIMCLLFFFSIGNFLFNDLQGGWEKLRFISTFVDLRKALVNYLLPVVVSSHYILHMSC